jgi:hypothetical protein
VGEVSVDLMIIPPKDEEKDRLEVTKWELDEERKKFTAAAVRLGKGEKVKLEFSLLFCYFRAASFYKRAWG